MKTCQKKHPALAIISGLLLLSTALWTFLLPMPCAAVPAPEAESGSGHMLVLPEGQESPLQLPLKHTRVKADITGITATVRVIQEFGNPYTTPIEAIYVFPLPHNAAVYAMKMVIGERVIEGKIKPRREAQEIYNQAKQQGRTASLLDQERPNIFTQSVANILPGDDIKVEISYFQDLSYVEGSYEFVFPMVVGPRYIPGQPSGQTGSGWSPDTGRVPDGSRISPPLLPPEVRSGHDIEVHVELDAGLPFRDLETPSHAIRVTRETEAQALITLAPGDRIPNKDFILRWKVDQKDPVAGWLAHKDSTGGYFLLLLQPEVHLARAEIAPREYVFVIDTSGSMHGFPLDQCKRIVEKCLKDLKPDDRFQIVLFAGSASTLAPAPLDATAKNIRRALQYVSAARGGGGTEFLPALKKALNVPPDPERARIVLFLSDGYIGYETEVLKYMDQHRGDTNLFPLGVGSSVNRYLIDGMARIGQGEPFYLTPDEDPEPVVERFFNYVSRPSLINIEVEFKGIEVSELRPYELPDLFAGRPLSLVGKYEKGGRGKVVLTGWLAGHRWKQTLKVKLPDRETKNPGLACLWARRSIEALSDQQALGEISEKQAKKRITELALRYSLMSAYTSFVAVDSQVRNPEGNSQTVAIPIPLPDQVSPLAAPSHAYVGNSGGSFLSSIKGIVGRGRACQKLATTPPCAGDRLEVREISSQEEAEPDTSRVEGEDEAGISIIELKVKGTLDKETVIRMLEKTLEEWLEDHCLNGIQGTLTLSLEVLPDGKVVRVRVPDRQNHAEQALQCLLKKAKNLSFPKASTKSYMLVKLFFS